MMKNIIVYFSIITELIVMGFLRWKHYNSIIE